MTRVQPADMRSALILSFAALLAVAGCSTPKMSDLKPSKLFSLDSDEPKEGTPVRVVGTWTDSVLTQPGQTAQRGFGGRLVFYGRKDDKPILVDGQLVVYAFNESGRDVTDNRPTRRYVFPQDQMPLHMSKSEVGASYSFWLPWDEVGGPQTEVSLICRFEPKGGGVITSEQTRHMLAGTMGPNVATASKSPPKVPEGVPSRPAQVTLESLQASRNAERYAQHASYDSASDPQAAATAVGGAAAESDRRMTTTSIKLPQNFQIPVTAPPAAPPNLLQPAPQAMPMQPQQPANSALQPMPVLPAAQPQALSAPSFGTFATQEPRMPAAAMPPRYSPTSASFGLAASAPLPYQAVQGGTPHVAGAATAGGMFANSTQAGGTGTQPQQQTPMPQAQQTITLPASQPLPPPSGITTTVSYPSSAPQGSPNSPQFPR